MPHPPPRPSEIADYVEQTARQLNVKLDPSDLPVVVAVFTVLARNAEALMAHELPESIEAAPVFRIPERPERDR